MRPIHVVGAVILALAFAMPAAAQVWAPVGAPQAPAAPLPPSPDGRLEIPFTTLPPAARASAPMPPSRKVVCGLTVIYPGNSVRYQIDDVGPRLDPRGTTKFTIRAVPPPVCAIPQTPGEETTPLPAPATPPVPPALRR